MNALIYKTGGRFLWELFGACVRVNVMGVRARRRCKVRPDVLSPVKVRTALPLLLLHYRDFRLCDVRQRSVCHIKHTNKHMHDARTSSLRMSVLKRFDYYSQGDCMKNFVK